MGCPTLEGIMQPMYQDEQMQYLSFGPLFSMLFLLLFNNYSFRNLCPYIWHAL
jgi:hypothetical protein